MHNPILVSVDELQKSVDKLKEVKVPPQEPPKTTQTIGLLLLPPPSPLNSVTQALQESSTLAGVDQETQVKSIGSSPVTVTHEEKQVEENKQKEEKEETKD